MENRRVLAVFPHPDDMEILCAGTLIRLRALGFEVHVATMTAGDAGSATLPPEEIAAVRREEARQGALAVGAESYRCLEFRDLQIVFDNPSRRKVAGLLREVDPFLVFTTPPEDYMFDHEITSRLVRDACFSAPIRNYAAEGDAKPSSGVPCLYYTDPIEGIDPWGEPVAARRIVDVSEVIERTADALKRHDSQRSWLQKLHGMDNYIESMKAWCARRGRQIGAAYGEGFRQHRGHPYPHDDLLGSLLGARAPVYPAN
jgi:LmbE family N-acetylglucosaminyl deacetylase